jgi:hypothetical protein
MITDIDGTNGIVKETNDYRIVKHDGTYTVFIKVPFFWVLHWWEPRGVFTTYDAAVSWYYLIRGMKW